MAYMLTNWYRRASVVAVSAHKCAIGLPSHDFSARMDDNGGATIGPEICKERRDKREH